jgi:hypothetical protein
MFRYSGSAVGSSYIGSPDIAGGLTLPASGDVSLNTDVAARGTFVGPSRTCSDYSVNTDAITRSVLSFSRTVTDSSVNTDAVNAAIVSAAKGNFFVFMYA